MEQIFSSGNVRRERSFPFPCLVFRKLLTAKLVLLLSLEMFVDDPRLELAHLEHALKVEKFFHMKKRTMESRKVVLRAL